MSSPIFFQSSSPARSQPPSERRNRTPGSARLRSRLNEVSSPLRYSSSSQAGWNTSDPRTGGLLSDDRGSTHTPRRRRGDIHSSATLDSPSLRQVVYGTARSSDGLASMSGLGTSEADVGEPTRVIWGTNISIQDTMNTVRGFFMSFKTKYRMKYDDQPIEHGQGEDLYYVDMLSKMHTLGLTNLNLDLNNFLAYPSTKKLFYQTQNYPQEIIPIIDQAIKETMHTIYEDRGASIEELEEIDQSFYRVRPYGLKSDRGMRELNPNDIDKLVSIKGIVIRTTPVIPDMKEAFFKCTKCGHTTTVELERGRIAEPTQCPREVCKSNGTMEIVHNRCIFADKQVIKLQETPDLVPDGQTPHSVSLCVYDDLVDVCRAGDRIEVTGIFQSMPIRVNPRQRAVKSLFKTYLDVVHIQKADKKRLGPDISTLGLESDFASQEQDGAEEARKISEEDIAKIKEIAARPDAYDLLSRSIAPSIYELDDVKKGILLQLFGGANKTFEKGGSPRYRGDVNILLCGDPSTSKSQLLQYVHKIAPRGVYTSGKSSSAVGLTAYVTRDPETRQYVLESGALVLSDGGICCIDEFDKMSDSTRAVLHEVMEQQTVSVAKAGIITSLNARTSILASANPIGSRYNPKLPVPQNIDLPPTLLSRFDLVYLMLDKVDEETDRKLARHIAGMYLEDRPENAATDEILPIEFLTMYISYAKQYVTPVISEPAKQALVDAYVKLRRMGEDARSAEKRVTATTRQLESMIRLSEALAKMKLSDTVTEQDVLEADRLIRHAIKDYATDPRTGQIDMDMVTTGLTAEERRNKEAELRSAEAENLEE